MTARIGTVPLALAGRTDELRISAPILAHFSDRTRPYALIPGLPQGSVPLGDLCVEPSSYVVRKGALDDERLLVELEHARRGGKVRDTSTTLEIGSDKLVFGDADLLTSKLRPYLGKTIRNPDPMAVGTTEWVPIRCGSQLKPEFLLLLMQSRFYLDLVTVFMAGKEHPRVRPETIFMFEVPACSPQQQQGVLDSLSDIQARISGIEDELETSKADVATKVFARRFAFDTAAFEQAKRTRTFKRALADHSVGRDARLDPKFLSPATMHVLAELGRHPTRPVGKCVSSPIVLGASLSPSNYDESTSYFYASMATIRHWHFDAESANTVSESYYASKPNKRVVKNDILMARSGEAIGKVALVQDEDLEAVFADFTMRIRMKDVLPEYAAYYFMSAYFQHLVHANKKGHANFNIFPGQISELPLLFPSEGVQREIAEEIAVALGEFDRNVKTLDKLRRERDDMLAAALQGLSPASNRRELQSMAAAP